MERTRLVFVLIILVAVAIIGSAALLSNPGSSDQGAADQGGTQATEMPASSVQVLVASSNTKQLWMDRMVAQFNAQQVTTSTGEVVVVEVEHVGSGSSMNAILEEQLQPVVWSPGSSTWVEQINRAWLDRNARRLISDECPATVDVPLGIAMWQPMAEVLGWPDAPISWRDLAELAADPDGWASLEHPEWGVFRFGHGHPAHSNSGMLSMIAEVYSAAGVSEGLTPDDVWSESVVSAVGAVETAVFHYGRKDTDLLGRMTLRGPGYLHAVTTYEGNVIRWNQEHADELRFPLVMIYPADGTFWVDNPFCVLNNADWVTETQIEGAQLFRDFILGREQQAQLIETGLRPALQGIPLHEPISLEYGAVPTITEDTVSALPYPSDEVVRHILDMWYQVKKPATILMVIDTSGSMQGEKMRAAVDAAREFITLMQPNDEIVALAFNYEVFSVGPSGLVGEVGEELRQSLDNLIAIGGTALHAVTIDAIDRIEAMRAEDLANGERRSYAIVLMTDGRNESNDGVTEAQMLSALPDGTESDEVRLYTIAYGEDANTDLLATMANRTNGKTYVSTPENIRDIYFLISSEF